MGDGQGAEPVSVWRRRAAYSAPASPAYPRALNQQQPLAAMRQLIICRLSLHAPHPTYLSPPLTSPHLSPPYVCRWKLVVINPAVILGPPLSKRTDSESVGDNVGSGLAVEVPRRRGVGLWSASLAVPVEAACIPGRFAHTHADADLHRAATSWHHAGVHHQPDPEGPDVPGRPAHGLWHRGRARRGRGTHPGHEPPQGRGQVRAEGGVGVGAAA